MPLADDLMHCRLRISLSRSRTLTTLADLLWFGTYRIFCYKLPRPLAIIWHYRLRGSPLAS